MRLLLAEDNRELAHWLEKALVQNGFAVDCVFDGGSRPSLHSETYALAVLDINMPGLDGSKSFSGCASAGRRFLSCC